MASNRSAKRQKTDIKAALKASIQDLPSALFPPIFSYLTVDEAVGNALRVNKQWKVNITNTIFNQAKYFYQSLKLQQKLDDLI